MKDKIKFPTFSKNANRIDSWMFAKMTRREQETLIKEAEVFQSLYRAIILKGGFAAGLEREF